MNGAVRATLLLLPAALAACEPYRIEYHKRPGWYAKMNEELPDRAVMDDGTIVVWNAKSREAALAGSDAPKETFKIRRENPDGTVTLAHALPADVIANTLTCLRNEEYQLIWDEILAESTRMAYVDAGLGYDGFVEYCKDNRIELGRTLNRMLSGIPSHETTIMPLGSGFQVRLWPGVAQALKYRAVDIVRENFELKLATIR